MTWAQAIRIIIAVVLCVAAAVFVVLGAVNAPLMLPSAKSYAPQVKQYATEYGLDAHMVLAIAAAESSFDPTAVSSAGAVGLMQIMPATAKWICEREGWTYAPAILTDATCSLRLACCYLAYLSTMFEGEWLLAAYNAGEGAVRAWQKEGLTPADIPYAETRHYVRKVTKLAKAYRARGLCG